MITFVPHRHRSVPMVSKDTIKDAIKDAYQAIKEEEQEREKLEKQVAKIQADEDAFWDYIGNKLANGEEINL